MKLIKFDLPINGTKVKNLEELRDNLTDEILVLARSSQLERWLRTRQLPEQAQAVAAVVQREGTDRGLFLALCGVLEVEAHPGDVRAIFDAPPAPGRFISGARYFELYEDLKNSLENKVADVKNTIYRNNANEKTIVNKYSEKNVNYSDRNSICAEESNSDVGKFDFRKFSIPKKILDVKFTNKCFGGLSAFQHYDFASGGKVVNVFVKKGSRVVKGSLIAEVINGSSLERIYSPIGGYVEKVFFEVGGYIKIAENLISVAEAEA
jgi:biotin carboxyl carrier protein